VYEVMHGKVVLNEFQPAVVGAGLWVYMTDLFIKCNRPSP